MATKKRTTTKTAVRKSSRTNPSEPIGTATEKVFTYWRTPRFKKDRAWLEEHLGQQRLFQYNPAVVRVESLGSGKHGVMVGNQLIGKPTTKEIAQRRVRAMKATAQKFSAKVNPARQQDYFEVVKMLSYPKASIKGTKKAYREALAAFNRLGTLRHASYAYEAGVEAGIPETQLRKDIVKPKQNPSSPTITIAERENPSTSTLHITEIGPRNWVVMLGRYRLKGGFKTAAAAQLYIDSIRKRRRNPHSPKLAAKAAQTFMHSFDVDSDGDLDENDIRILEQFNDASIVVDDDDLRIGTVLGKMPSGDLHIQWGDDTTSMEDPADVFKVNGIRAWRIRRRKTHRRNPAQRELNQLRVTLRKIADAATVTPEHLRAAFKAGEMAGYSQDETWSLVQAALGRKKSLPKQYRSNPGLLSAFAELMVGTASALQVKDHLSKAKKRTETKTAVRRSSVKQNPDAFTEFQGRTPTHTLELETPPGTPKKLWSLGRLLEIRVAGYGTLDLRPKQFYLCADDRNRQMYIAGPPIVAKQDLPDGHTLPLGEVSHVVYETEKSHLGDAAGEPSAYIHKLGEEGGARPLLAVDKSGYGHIEGGDYEITPLGIKD